MHTPFVDWAYYYNYYHYCRSFLFSGHLSGFLPSDREGSDAHRMQVCDCRLHVSSCRGGRWHWRNAVSRDTAGGAVYVTKFGPGGRVDHFPKNVQ